MKTQNYTLKNDIWNIPFLPPFAKSIGEMSATNVCISNRAKGEWKFLPSEIENIPSPYAEKQDFDFAKVNDSDWQDVLVPSSLTMQGFDIKNNKEYYYKRTIHLSKEAVDKGLRAFILFEGVYSNCRVWVDNEYKATHIGGFTPFVVEITDNVKDDYTADIVVGVSDIEGTEKGTWNATGEKISDCAWASYYAHMNVGGILRDVTVFYLPKQNYILSNHINAGLANDFKDGKLDMNMLVVANGQKTLKIQVLDKFGVQVYESEVLLNNSYKIDKNFYDKEFKLDFDNFNYILPAAKKSDKHYSELYVPFKRCQLGADLYAINVQDVVKNIIAWNAEQPYLYTLKLTLYDNVSDSCVYEEKIGFRQIDFAGSNGTDKNKIYVNGNEIKLRGVCRHDVSHLYGRSLSKEEELQEILAFKRNNVNHVRTSHYPASKHYLSLCDEYGIYVELENGVCFKGGNGYDMYCAGEELIQTFSEMVEFNHNHSSVLIWSTGNESGFEKSCGFRLSFNYIREKDSKRPAIFSYPFNVKSKPLPYDIFSKHYHKVYRNLGKKDMPKLHDEFAHVSCYNLEDLGKDNNYRLAWGDSIKMGWENMIKDDGALGCAIWGGIDDVFYVPSNITVAHQRHSSAQTLGYGEWGSVLDAYKREKPEAYLTKKAFSPIRVDKFSCNSKGVGMKLKNWFDHVNLSEVQCVIKNDVGTELFNGKMTCDIPAKSVGIVKLLVDIANTKTLDVAFYFAGVEVERNLFNVSKNQGIAKTFDSCQVKADMQNAIIEICKNDKTIATGPYLFIKGKKVASQSRKITHNVSENAETYMVEENFGSLKKAKYIIELSNNGKIAVTMKNSIGMYNILGNNYGVAFELADGVDSVEWKKDCLYSYYPENHLERPVGVARIKDKENTVYGVKPDYAWKDDNYDYFFNNEIESDKLYVSQDFKTTRTDIKEYGVNIDTNQLKVYENGDKINCFTTYSKVTDYTDCKSDKIKTTGSWKIINKNNEKCCTVSRQKGSSISIDFTGVGIKIYGTRSKEQGVINIFIDGKKIRSTSARSDICDVLDFMILDSVVDLSNEKHTLTITLDDNKGVRISGFEVMHTAEQKTQSFLYVSRGKYYKSLAWGNYYGKKLKNSERKSLSFDMTVIKRK